MTTKNDNSKKIMENAKSIQDGFHKVLSEHGIDNLRVSEFTLSNIENKNNISSKITGGSRGCYRTVCRQTPTGNVCREVWDPNC